MKQRRKDVKGYLENSIGRTTALFDKGTAELGCIGILTDWIDRSINAARSNQKSRLTPKDVELSALSVYQRYMLAKEMKQGEDDWHNQFVHIQDAREVLLMTKNGH